MPDTLSSRRYEPVNIDTTDKNNSYGIIVELTGQNKKVLEIGNSTGYISKILRDNGNVVTGIEIDNEAAEVARKYCEKEIIGDVESMDLDACLDPRGYDVIILGDVLEHLKYPEIILKKLRRSLARNGYLVVSLPNVCHGDMLLNLLYGDFKYTDVGLLDRTHLRFFGLKNIVELFNDQGYEISNIHKTTHSVGWTELRVDMNKVPWELRNFINALPNSSVYQFVFTAAKYKSTIVKQDVEETQLERIFKVAVVDAILADPERRIKPLEETRTALMAKVDDKENKISELEQNAVKYASLISTLNEVIRERDAQIFISDREIAGIKQSLTWRSVMKFQHLVDMLLPPSSGRGKVYGIGLRGLRILISQGPVKLVSRSRSFIQAGKANNDARSTYDEWIRSNEPSKEQLAHMRDRSMEFSYRPRISIIMPVWNTDKRWLCKAIDSVIGQTYDNWELCIADGRSTRAHIRSNLKSYSSRDDRIKVKFLEDNLGIAGNSNEALSMASGDLIALLDHDDELAPFALYECVKLLNENSSLDFIYSDEDKIGTGDKRWDPFFKPGWSPDFLLACGYTNHLSIYRKKIVDMLGGFRKDFDGSQDLDLLLRFTESIPQENIAHIPKVLYHWRQIAGSTSMDPHAKNSMVISMARKALEDTLRRRDIKGSVVDGLWPGSYHVKQDIIGDPLVTIIIPTKDKLKLLKNCVDSIENRSSYRNHEILIVDNNSTEPETLEYLDKTPYKVLRYPGTFNFSKINNFAVKHASGEYVIFLNNDTEVITPGWIEALLEQAQIPEIGAVGCKLLYPGGSVQHAGVILGMSPDQATGIAGHIYNGSSYEDNGYFGAINVIKNYSAVTAACMMMRKSVFDEMGGFDEGLAVCYNDVDLCLRLGKIGYRIVYTPYAELFHYESGTRGRSVDINEAHFMMERWGDLIRNDTYYSPNLTLSKYSCEIDIG